MGNHAKKVIDNDVTVSNSKKVRDAFIQKDAKTIKDYAFFDVFVPSVKRTIYDLITRIFGMALFGDKSAPSSQTRYNGFSSYDYAKPYQPVSYGGGSTYKPAQESQNTSTGTYGFDYESWVFSNRGDVEAVLNQMTDIIETYGFASVVDLYDSVGKTAPYTSENFGWKSMNGCQPQLCSGGWRLCMTKVCAIK